MFDMRQIGKRISELRKEKNFTQVELADKLGISYQAVSNWENGNSMPDIAKLEDLSKIFEISIDELLGNDARAKVVKNILKNEKIKLDDTDEDVVKDVLPLIKPDRIEDSFEADELSLHHLVMLAPFLDRDVLDDMVKDTYELGQIKMLIQLAPFCSDEILDDIVKKELEEGHIESSKSVIAIAPFIGQETVDLLLLNVYEEQGVKAIIGLAPFASQRVIDQIVAHELDQKHVKEVMPLMPFASQSDDMKEALKKPFKDYFQKKSKEEDK